MARITFKGKVQDVWYVGDDSAPAYRYVQVPTLDRKHCDMAAFRAHPKYGAYANSDLFLGMLSRIRAQVFSDCATSGHMRLDRIPAGVTVDTSGFLAVVSFDV